MLKLTYDKPAATEEEVATTTALTLLDENDSPTPLFVGLVALELLADALIAHVIYKAGKKIRG